MPCLGMAIAAFAAVAGPILPLLGYIAFLVRRITWAGIVDSSSGAPLAVRRAAAVFVVEVVALAVVGIRRAVAVLVALVTAAQQGR